MQFDYRLRCAIATQGDAVASMDHRCHEIRSTDGPVDRPSLGLAERLCPPDEKKHCTRRVNGSARRVCMACACHELSRYRKTYESCRMCWLWKLVSKMAEGLSSIASIMTESKEYQTENETRANGLHAGYNFKLTWVFLSHLRSNPDIIDLS